MLRRVRPPEAVEARVPAELDVFLAPLVPVRFEAVPVGFDLRVALDDRPLPLLLPLLPSFEVKASTASRGALTVLRAPLTTFAAGSLNSGVRFLRLEMSLPTLLAATCATVATPAPAANPPAAETRKSETRSEA